MKTLTSKVLVLAGLLAAGSLAHADVRVDRHHWAPSGSRIISYRISGGHREPWVVELRGVRYIWAGNYWRVYHERDFRHGRRRDLHVTHFDYRHELREERHEHGRDRREERGDRHDRAHDERNDDRKGNKRR